MSIEKALVSLAGRGTRFFPASHAMRKELFPVLGPDGVVRPILHHQLRALWRSGFREIGLVVRPEDVDGLKRYFAGPSGDDRAALQGNPRHRTELEEMEALGASLTYLEQGSPAGFGHAVWCARDFAGGTPFLLCTGDLLFRESAYTVMVEAFARGSGRSVSGVCRIGAGELHGYGTIGGHPAPDAPGLLEITRLIEKPSPELARAELRIDGLPPETWLGWFGLHALSPTIFEILDEALDTPLPGEIQLTPAQDALRVREGYYAVELPSADRFDFGLPKAFPESLARFAAVG